jgi:hypothetical protein
MLDTTIATKLFSEVRKQLPPPPVSEGLPQGWETANWGGGFLEKIERTIDESADIRKQWEATRIETRFGIITVGLLKEADYCLRVIENRPDLQRDSDFRRNYDRARTDFLARLVRIHDGQSRGLAKACRDFVKATKSA